MSPEGHWPCSESGGFWNGRLAFGRRWSSARPRRQGERITNCQTIAHLGQGRATFGALREARLNLPSGPRSEARANVRVVRLGHVRITADRIAHAHCALDPPAVPQPERNLSARKVL